MKNMTNKKLVGTIAKLTGVAWIVGMSILMLVATFVGGSKSGSAAGMSLFGIELFGITFLENLDNITAWLIVAGATTVFFVIIALLIFAMV
ncbi:MAG: hypothetical protein FWD76_02460, partial [Firmicutes bacterium]|nr:hypothetical protein [Bacillota bacterium]